MKRVAAKAVFLSLGAGLFETTAVAAEPSYARLEYSVEDESGACPSEVDFRERVTRRLGYDPFRREAMTLLRVRIVQRSSRAEAKISSERTGAPPGKRELVDARCETLAEAVASTVAMVIDPIAASAPPSSPSPSPSPSPPPAPPSNDSPSPLSVAAAPPADTAGAPPSEARVHPVLLADFVGSIGRTASLALGARLGVGIRIQSFSITGEGRFETTPSAAAVTSIDRVEYSSYGLAAAPCLHVGIFQGCAALGIASVQARALNLALPVASGKAIPSVSLRGGIVVPLGSLVALRANVEAGVPLVRVDYVIDGATVWTTSAVEGAVGVGLGARL